MMAGVDGDTERLPYPTYLPIRQRGRSMALLSSSRWWQWQHSVPSPSFWTANHSATACPTPYYGVHLRSDYYLTHDRSRVALFGLEVWYCNPDLAYAKTN